MFTGLLIAVLGTVSLTVAKPFQQTKASNLIVANIEALADIELQPGIWVVSFISEDEWQCTHGGRFACPGTVF
ncbi:MAG: hypothetical protein J1E78_02130 [Muribaculaceae bacterium]|nr:hypothetical protein [Muribaculaceae bacterium]